MAQTVGDFIDRRLLQWGTNRVVGYPGDGINGIMAAVEREQGE
jgi:pyruvate dehydrogenase (quinone)